MRATKSGGLDVIRQRVEAVFEQLAGIATAFTALGGDAEFARQIAHGAGAVFHGLLDLVVGDGFAEANVHGGGPVGRGGSPFHSIIAIV